ncbi:ABC1 family protein MCP2 [Penicillium angulare]|uniref:ABC1 family protein MCP2 n=1 Tax=Penicillium angulare TaxID=116970 RepID=A0A9W9G7J4_9EURO|nr:ABC1 family protein MCP2 [Penicillium angulare]
MRATFCSPLRALANPALVVRQTPKASIVNTSLGLPRSAAFHTSFPSRTAFTKPCSSRLPKRNIFAAPSCRNFATTTRTLLSAEEKEAALKLPRTPRRRVFRLFLNLGLGALAVWVWWDYLEHPYEAAKRSGRVVGTLAVCINDYRVTLKQEFPTPEDRNASIRACHKRCAERTLRVLEKNGSIFIKLGQHLSSMGYLLPVEWTTTFIPLQDKCPVSSIESIREMFVKDTGQTIDELFSSFDPEPIGAASLAQVHLATLKETGQKVAVKVQHPALAEWVPLDLGLTRFTFSMLKWFFPEYDLEWLSREMDLSLPVELDFRMEAQNATEASEYFKKHSDAPLVIPEVMWSQRRILVMECISGSRPDDLAFLDANNIDRDEVSAAFAHIFNEMIFGDEAPLHCDPHGGNIAIRPNPDRSHPNFDIILYDHGLYRNIPRDLRRNYAKLWLAVMDADVPRMREYAYKVAGVTDEQFPLFASAITGRDYRVLTKNIVSSRNEGEKKHMSQALGEGMLQQLVVLLGQVPRIILLILKTNDLTRSLDENLHTRQGPMRTFLILARYATRTVFEEQMENIKASGGIFLNFFRYISAWAGFLRVEVKLSVYESVLSLKSRFGLQSA